MGLDAVVYRNVRDILVSIRDQGIVIDPTTGQVSLSGDRPDPPGNDFVAEERRLGNFAAIIELRETIKGVLGSNTSVLIEKVLYSASHSGDQINPRDFKSLGAEIIRLRNASSPLLAEFLDDMQALLTAADREQNPIVFE